jgi:hypothetical protein
MEVLHSTKAQQENSEIREWVKNTHAPAERESSVFYIRVWVRGAIFIEEETSTVHVN